MHIRGLGDRWLAGEEVPGVTFAHNDSVEILTGSHAAETGTIVLLVNVAPEPSYLVKLGPGRGDVRIRQSSLRSVTGRIGESGVPMRDVPPKWNR